MKHEIDSKNFKQWLDTATDCRNLVFQAYDLRGEDEKLASLPQAEKPEDACVYLGCQLGPKLAAAAAKNFGVVFPDFPQRPYKPYRDGLYTWESLIDGFDPTNAEATYRNSVDWLSYISFIKVDAANKPLKPVQYVEVGPDEVLARRLHDHFIDDELTEFLAAYRVPAPKAKGIVAIMGGHDRSRSDVIYRQVAHLARDLTREGYLVASGGGPGLMEAANMGAYFASLGDDLLDPAIAEMAAKADKYDAPNWLSSAWEVRQRYEDKVKIDISRSLGVPTWFYGHEPPNIFATHIAKYFENSLREEGLLAIATHGVIFAEGNAGTVQEIFQDACQNYYENYGFKSPMILFGENYWDLNPLIEPAAKGAYDPKLKPAYSLLKKLAGEKGFGHLITLTSSTDVVKAEIKKFSDAFKP